MLVPRMALLCGENHRGQQGTPSTIQQDKAYAFEDPRCDRPPTLLRPGMALELVTGLSNSGRREQACCREHAREGEHGGRVATVDKGGERALLGRWVTETRGGRKRGTVSGAARHVLGVRVLGALEPITSHREVQSSTHPRSPLDHDLP